MIKICSLKKWSKKKLDGDEDEEDENEGPKISNKLNYTSREDKIKKLNEKLKNFN